VVPMSAQAVICGPAFSGVTANNIRNFTKMNKLNDGHGTNGRQQGFTLVEMSIVLVVIGIILGAVAIGTGLQRDAEQKRIKQTFIDQWVQAYNSYYQRTGVVLGDDETNPRLMVNGLSHSPASNNDPLSGGDMSGVAGPDAICERAAGQGMTRAASADRELRDLMQRTGVRLPPGRATGQEDRYLYLDSNGNPQELQVCFQWNPPGTASGSGNVMVITGLTPDLARTLDQMIDGSVNARGGAFRQEGVVQAVDPITWTTDNLEDIGGGAATTESQIAVVTAHLKMSQ
jgi:prepilin-type N-terminal cleavage/methylation domain-containing protein